MAKIYCYRCNEDTNYKTTTAISSRTRSTIINQNDDINSRLHFCITCWEALVGEVVS